MSTPVFSDARKRHDFVLLFDVRDGNPNGDPDMGNMPRMDPETSQGLVTDVAIKRKVRDYVAENHGGQERNKIYVQSTTALNTMHGRAYTALNLTSTGTKQKTDDIDQATAWMCENFYDVRMFGAVMSTKPNCGQVRGPLQLTFARSIDPITPMDISVVRSAVTRPEEMAVEVSADDGKVTGGKRGTIGHKFIVNYALYQAHGFFMPHLAARTGVTDEDLALFWRALYQMWGFDRSSARGYMSCRGVLVFTHENPLGNAPAQELFKRIEVTTRDGVVGIETAALPAGVTLTRLGWMGTEEQAAA